MTLIENFIFKFAFVAKASGCFEVSRDKREEKKNVQNLFIIKSSSKTFFHFKILLSKSFICDETMHIVCLRVEYSRRKLPNTRKVTFLQHLASLVLCIARGRPITIAERCNESLRSPCTFRLCIHASLSVEMNGLASASFATDVGGETAEASNTAADRETPCKERRWPKHKRAPGIPLRNSLEMLVSRQRKNKRERESPR